MGPTYRIIVGPTAMYVERHGIRSETIPLGEEDDPAAERAKGAALYATIKRLVEFYVWLRHRAVMAAQRRFAAHVAGIRAGRWFPGPRPDLISTKPWRDTRCREWTSVPHGVAARLLRSGRA